jgi:hypothetical protein
MYSSSNIPEMISALHFFSRKIHYLEIDNPSSIGQKAPENTASDFNTEVDVGSVDTVLVISD